MFISFQNKFLNKYFIVNYNNLTINGIQNAINVIKIKQQSVIIFNLNFRKKKYCILIVRK